MMLAYTCKKILLAVPTLVIVSLIIFSLMRLIPGDPAVVMLGDLQDPVALEQIRREMGLDRPWPVQFALWLSDVLRGDLGVSIISGEPVAQAMLQRFAVTAQFVLLAVLIAAGIAIPAGMLAAWRQHSALDTGITLTAIVCVSIPSFWVGLMLILFFGVQLQWLPTVGYVSIGDDLGQGLLYLVMPVLSLVLVEIATLVRMSRSSAIEVLGQEYITHARAKGLAEASVLWRHAFKNAFAPTMTLLGLILGSLLSGAAVIETLFSLPGLGRWLVEAIYARDYPVVQGVLLLVAAIYVCSNLLVDLLYPLFDPRVTLS